MARILRFLPLTTMQQYRRIITKTRPRTAPITIPTIAAVVSPHPHQLQVESSSGLFWRTLQMRLRLCYRFWPFWLELQVWKEPEELVQVIWQSPEQLGELQVKAQVVGKLPTEEQEEALPGNTSLSKAAPSMVKHTILPQEAQFMEIELSHWMVAIKSRSASILVIDCIILIGHYLWGCSWTIWKINIRVIGWESIVIQLSVW